MTVAVKPGVLELMATREGNGSRSGVGKGMTMKRPDAEEGRSASQLDWRSYGHQGLDPILQAALESIVEVGYHGTTIRKIAERAGLSVPGVYHHYASKHALLMRLMEYAMEDLWVRTQRALAEVNGSVRLELDRYVECMVLFHASQPALASIALTEIRSLNTEARKRHIQRRDRQHRALDRIVEQGCTEGIFGTPYPRQASTAIITMCTSVSQWFDPDGELAPAELAAKYQHFARSVLH